MQDYFQEQNPSKGLYFYLALALMLLVLVLSINTDAAHFALREKTGVPVEFFWIIFTVDILIVLSFVLIFFYKKAGAVLFPFFVLIHFFLHNFYLSTILFSDLNLLFVYFAAGLLVIIPRWKFFR